LTIVLGGEVQKLYSAVLHTTPFSLSFNLSWCIWCFHRPAVMPHSTWVCNANREKLTVFATVLRQC